MPSACIAAGCKNRNNMIGMHFHCLPLGNPALLKLWLEKLKLKSPPVKYLRQSLQCPFNLDSYLRDLRNELTNAKPKFRLKEDPIPTILDLVIVVELQMRLPQHYIKYFKIEKKKHAEEYLSCCFYSCILLLCKYWACSLNIFLITALVNQLPTYNYVKLFKI